METGAINLDQGFPDDARPENLRQSAADAVIEGLSQYSSVMGFLKSAML
jgi:aspartate/methionine/tyrosine aminotransferase